MVTDSLNITSEAHGSDPDQNDRLHTSANDAICEDRMNKHMSDCPNQDTGDTIHVERRDSSLSPSAKSKRHHKNRSRDRSMSPGFRGRHKSPNRSPNYRYDVGGYHDDRRRSDYHRQSHDYVSSPNSRNPPDRHRQRSPESYESRSRHRRREGRDRGHTDENVDAGSESRKRRRTSDVASSPASKELDESPKKDNLTIDERLNIRDRETEIERKQLYMRYDKTREQSIVRRDVADDEEEEKKCIDSNEQKKRELDEARRDDLTALVLNLSRKATDRDIWKFFSEKSGKVRDIQVIRDTRSGRSKGVGYVEFYSQDSLMKALTLNGQCIFGVPIKVQSSQAEKNRAAKVAKQQAAEAAEGGPIKIYVGGLIETLATITETELRALFGAFGDIVTVDIHKDPYTGKCKGFAFIQYSKASDAREAMAAMNGFEICGQNIKVGFATDSATHPMVVTMAAQGYPAATTATTLSVKGTSNSNSPASATLMSQSGDSLDTERLDDEGGGLLSGASTRIALMQKLRRDDTSLLPGMGPRTAVSPMNAYDSNAIRKMVVGTPQFQPAATALSQDNVTALCVPTTNVKLSQMFTKNDVLTEGNSFYDDVLEDVTSECSKFGTVIKSWVNRYLADGIIYLKYATPDQATAAIHALMGRQFSGNIVIAEYISDASWIHTCEQ